LFLEAEDLGQFEAFYLSTDTSLREDTKVVVERVCPDLKGMAANLSAEPLRAAAADMEAIGRHDRFDDADEALECLQRESDRFEKAAPIVLAQAKSENSTSA
jgi:HPt (histidine-containing phosphotransfer) domain-containing protein